MSARQFLRLALVVPFLACGVAHAQVFRAYLASDGSDANPCTLTQPCRLLPAALTAVASGGEIWMLDSANYNSATVTIGKSVSILAVPGAVGSLVALNGGPAVSITANGLTIALRNIVIAPVAGATPGTHGIHMTGASNLTIEASLITNLPQKAVWVVGSGIVNVADSTLRNNGGGGIVLWGGAHAVVASSRLLGNFHGVTLSGESAGTTTSATISDCVISGAFVGVAADTLVAATVRASVARSTIERNTYALAASTSDIGIAEIEISGNQIAGNNNALYWLGTGAAILTAQNNQIGAAQATTGTPSPQPLQ